MRMTGAHRPPQVPHVSSSPSICLQIPPHDGHPCCSAIHFPLPGHVQDFHLRERAHGAQTKRAPPGAHNAKRSPLVRLLSSTTHIFLTPGSFAASMRLPLPVPALPGRMQPAAKSIPLVPRLQTAHRIVPTP